MAVYVNRSARPQIFNAQDVVYTFETGGYYPATDELAEPLLSGLLVEEVEAPVGSVLAIREVTFVSDAASPSAVADVAVQVDGVQATASETLVEAREIERHLHNRERWAGLAAIPTDEVRADFETMTPFRMDAGNDTWGDWLRILGTGDTPVIAGMTTFDFHRILVTDVETTLTGTRIQIACGASGAAALAAGNFTEIMAHPEKNARSSPLHLIDDQVLSGEIVWARCWVDGEDTSWIDFFIGLHEYSE